MFSEAPAEDALTLDKLWSDFCGVTRRFKVVTKEGKEREKKRAIIETNPPIHDLTSQADTKNRNNNPVELTSILILSARTK